MNFSQELKKIILSHPVTSKQPPEIVQIHMRHPVRGLVLLDYRTIGLLQNQYLYM